MEKQGKKVCGMLVGWDWFFFSAGHCSGAFALLFFSNHVTVIFSGVFCPPVSFVDVIVTDDFYRSF